MNAVDKTLSMLDVIKEYHSGIHLSDLSDKLDMPMSSVHRMLASLVRYGYIFQNKETKRYHLGYKFLEMSRYVLDNIDVRTLVKPYMYDLVDRVKEACHLAILVDRDVVFVDRMDSSYSITANQKIGLRCPAYLTASGKAILAGYPDYELQRIISRFDFSQAPALTGTPRTAEDFYEELMRVRELGYAIDDEEAEAGGRCIAVALQIYGITSRFAISISGPITRMDREYMETALARELKETSSLIHRDLSP